MKFSKYIQSKEQHFPKEWRKHMFPYKSFKKRIKYIVDELDQKTDIYKRRAPQNGQLVKSSSKTSFSSDLPSSSSKSIIESKVDTTAAGIPVHQVADDDGKIAEAFVFYNGSKINLDSEMVFYQKLEDVIGNFTFFEKKIVQEFYGTLEKLQDELMDVTSPFQKDLEYWKKIFACYLDKNLWEHKKAPMLTEEWINNANQVYIKFLRDVHDKNLTTKFRCAKSMDIFSDFEKINKLLIMLTFLWQLNYNAIRKIIKKHDKRTGLFTKNHYLDKMSSEKPDLMNNLVSQLLSRFVKVLPMLEDYECPVCLSILVNPIRLVCSHLMCYQCTMMSRVTGNTNCPICRHEKVMENATKHDIDKSLNNMIKLYFPKEIKLRKREIYKFENEQMAKSFGLDKYNNCKIM